MTTLAPPPVAASESLAAAEFIIRSQEATLNEKDAQILSLREALGDDAPYLDGIATLRRMRALEDAVDLTRQFFAGRAEEAAVRAALEDCRRIA